MNKEEKCKENEKIMQKMTKKQYNKATKTGERRWRIEKDKGIYYSRFGHGHKCIVHKIVRPQNLRL
jgi:hypothetical protein